ncbi:carboxypeptidase regulatory-like domain-containing protein [Telmatobacter bradus]|uniref:carboxypeptidase regulatory-like domain-containing protein n=1 Tax=Telmatobacter bradus TaxID=474953 RepID=UPI003B43763B
MAASTLPAALAVEVHGQVFYRGKPVPGAQVTLKQDGTTLSTLTDQQGLYEFPDLAEGTWKVRIEMHGFKPLNAELKAATDAPQGHFDLAMLPLNEALVGSQTAEQAQQAPQMVALALPAKEKKKTDEAAPQAPVSEVADKAADGYLVNGSQNNAATSIYSLAPAFGNRRAGSKSLYNGSVGIIEGNSAFNARPYSLTGLNTPKDNYNQTTLVASVGGPLRFPHIAHNFGNFYVGYQWGRSDTASTLTGRVPTLDERLGDLSSIVDSSGNPVKIYNPSTGILYTGTIPISTQAAALLKLYPAPNLTGNSSYNYQTAVLSTTHTDALESRLNRSLGSRDHLYGGFGFKSTRSESTSLFDFTDTTDALGVDTNANWQHRYRHQLFVTLGYHFTRMRTEVRPEFDGRENISFLAGITGNNQDPSNWGPPTLAFSSGFNSLSDAESAFNRNRTGVTSVSASSMHRRHTFNFGGDFRRQEFNEYSQQNPRGSFTFTGTATAGGNSSAGSDLADFLLGVPDTSAIAYGNADKYFRQSVYDLFFTDDWRIRPDLTINAGLRWDYGAPITELKNRLVNLDVASDFSTATAVLASSPKGSTTGASYPNSLVRPDKRGIEPRIGLSWRPIPASTLVIRSGYGIYYDSSVYLGAAESMGQQAPLSTSESVTNSSSCALTLASGFPTTCSTAATDTFALDPHLHVGYAQNWNLSAQRDLPWALVISASYMGTKGTHGMQEILPNSYPLNATNPCSSCTSGYVYRTSGGNSSRNAGQLQLRRRLRSGFTASVDYTFAKAIDDDAQLGAAGYQSASVTSSSSSLAIAQNWRNPRAERSLSSFDQRQLVNVQAQYTSGMGMGGRTLMSSWSGRVLKEWTLTGNLKVGSGLPETPIYEATVPGTAFSGSLRPNLTGASLYRAASGYHLNSAAYSAPTTGTWGTAGRNSITGPDQFSLNGAMSRTFRVHGTWNLDVRADATNLLNHVTYTTWNAEANSTTFGLPSSASAMRSLQITGRMRF